MDMDVVRLPAQFHALLRGVGHEWRRESGAHMSENRRLGRIIAMQALFEFDAVASDPIACLEAAIEEHDAAPSSRTYAGHVMKGVLEHLDTIDAAIAEAAPQWPFEQIAGVDKAVLRIAVFELRPNEDVPPKAAINEAVEIAKLYGGEGSGRFVNGVLGYILEHDLSGCRGEPA